MAHNFGYLQYMSLKDENRLLRQQSTPESAILLGGIKMSTTGATEGKVEDAGNSIDDSLGSQRRTEELKKARQLKRSSWGATLLTICVGLCVLTGVL